MPDLMPAPKSCHDGLRAGFLEPSRDFGNCYVRNYYIRSGGLKVPVGSGRGRDDPPEAHAAWSCRDRRELQGGASPHGRGYPKGH